LGEGKGGQGWREETLLASYFYNNSDEECRKGRNNDVPALSGFAGKGEHVTRRVQSQLHAAQHPQGYLSPHPDLVSLQYSDGSEQSYSYLFFSGMFSGPPVIAYSTFFPT
jgi:hypothetical protein